MIKLIFLILSIGLFSCSSHEKHKMDQLQLQESVQRFYTRFTERVAEAFVSIPNYQTDPQLRDLSLNQYLVYHQEALKIATAPYPEVNLLDMIVFINLSKMTIQDYWIPKRLGDRGKSLLGAFNESEKDLDSIALQILSRKELLRVKNVAYRWRQDHPHVVKVEKIRMGDFTDYIGGSKKNEPLFSGISSFSQILVDTKSAVEAVDETMLVANRALFLSQQIPYILRLQARLTSLEMVEDVTTYFGYGNSYRQAQEENQPGIMEQIRQTLAYIRSMPEQMQLARKGFHEEVWYLAKVVLLIFSLIALIWWSLAWLVKYRHVPRSKKGAKHVEV